AALTRLLDAIGENPLYASAIRLIQAQRLIRRLDDESKQPVAIDEALEAHLRKILDSITATVDLSFLPQAKLFKPGSTAENPFGYSGQFAIRELMTMTPGLVQA